MKITTFLSLIIISLLFGCSSSLKVYTTHEKDVDFTTYKTFDFYEIKEIRNELTEIQLLSKLYFIVLHGLCGVGSGK